MNYNNDNPGGGLDPRFETVAGKLRRLAGYHTVALGKWHLGLSTTGHLPINRGFDRHLGFLGGGEDHWNQCEGACAQIPSVDLWQDHGPAPTSGPGSNGTYSAYLYTAEAVRVIETLPTGAPLFMYFAAHEVCP